MSVELVHSEHEFLICEHERKAKAAKSARDWWNAEAQTARKRELWLTGIL